MAQHKASLEKVLQSALAHKVAGSRLAETVASIEAIAAVYSYVLSPSTDEKKVHKIQSAVAHKVYGQRLQNAYEMLSHIITTSSLSLTAEDIPLKAQHKASLKKILTSAMKSTELGKQFADMCDLQDKALDALIAASSGWVKTDLEKIKNA